ncbi:uncharacterized protein E0L32_001719 [Thyridium curvatum]|uniref:Ribonuclease T2-like n=1 Tax=Thyridium curvatum TaxID=1093900 RepID=A0A507AXJ6_9PEZI|nr:uncharacterized protein E0L32_001480 [Thyridium curvatum]XP_030990970.1 uncharacterized protein E0L32_001719 [Thyridium curvatum]TPX09020.1 hypothetical protein E0L32_001480 [Thyridium curvatum]TPX09259.1 hypothetical protein E0L32_001719 [Thyridium curvatum]
MLSRVMLLEAALAVGGAVAASKSCPANLELSCHNTTAVDTCCTVYPGGQLLMTQFWDTDPSTGPADSWTIHGLWPDYCDGSYPQFCDKSREITNATQIMQAADKCTLAYMEKYWLDYQGDNEQFWEHEFNKHGTCISTLDRKCYSEYQTSQEVVDYFKTTVQLFKTLPSYKWLAAAGIVPSADKTYTLAEIQAAIKANYGFEAIVNCNKNTKAMNEIWYHFNTKGSVQTGKFVPVQPVGSSTCPKTGIKYLPKYGGGSPSATTTTGGATTTTTTATGTATTSGPAPTGGSALSGKAYLYVNTPSDSNGGFLISGGAWYRAGGTPATYTATPNADGTTFQLNSSKGKCGVQADSSFSCASGVTASNFGYDGSFLTYNGANTFYAASLPTGTQQGVVYTSQKAVSLQVTWSPRS